MVTWGGLAMFGRSEAGRSREVPKLPVRSGRRTCRLSVVLRREGRVLACVPQGRVRYRPIPHGNETVKVTAPSPVPLAPLAAAARRTGRYTVVVSPARSPLPP